MLIHPIRRNEKEPLALRMVKRWSSRFQSPPWSRIPFGDW